MKHQIFVASIHGATETIPGDFTSRGKMRYFMLYTKAFTESQARHIFEGQLLLVGCVLDTLLIYTYDHWLELEEEKKAWKKAHPKVSKVSKFLPDFKDAYRSKSLETSSDQWIASLPSFREQVKNELTYPIASQEDASLGGTLNVTLYPDNISGVYMVLYDKTGILPDCTLTIEQVRMLKVFLMIHEI